MNAVEQLEWCQRNHATVWFGKQDVKVKVKDLNTMKGATLEETIALIEKFREHRKQFGF